MTQTLDIAIEDKTYTIQALTIDQLEALHVGVARPPSDDPVAELWKHNREVIATALSNDYPEMTMEVLGRKRLGTVQAVKQIAEDILKFSGLTLRRSAADLRAQIEMLQTELALLEGESAPGEAGAEAASTGATSSGGSPQD
jgi:hypothetical protein